LERCTPQIAYLGVTLLLVASGAIATATFGSKWGVPFPPEVLEILGVVGGIIALVGIQMICRGVTAYLRESQIREVCRLRPNEPWHADYDWDEKQSGDDKRRGAYKWLFFAFVFGAFPFALYLRGVGPAPFIFFGPFFAISLISGIYYAAQYSKYGNSYLRFETFPYFLGQSLNAHLGTTKDIGPFVRVSFTLRCVEERRVKAPGKTVILCYQMYEETSVLEGPGEHSVMNPDLTVSFALPDDASLQTCLNGTPCRYWEIYVHAETPGLDFDEAFLVPVYAKAWSAERS
jgi:hypothetical protein